MPGVTLVTGAAGFAGSHLVDSLSADGVATVGWFRPGGHAPEGADQVEWQAVDLLDKAAVSAAVKDVRPAVVFHCAGAAHVGHSWATTTDTLRINVVGTHHLVGALREHVPDAQLLVTSSALVYAQSDAAIAEDQPLVPGSPYGLSKLAQEMAATAVDRIPRTYVARSFNHFGPRQDPSFVSAAFARQIAQIEAGLQPPEIIVGNLEPRRDLTDVRDTVRAYRDIVSGGEPARPYNVCSGAAIAVRELLERLVSIARLPVRIVHDPVRYRQNDNPVVLGDRTRITHEVGWAPRIPLDRTLHDLLEYWRGRTSAA